MEAHLDNLRYDILEIWVFWGEVFDAFMRQIALGWFWCLRRFCNVVNWLEIIPFVANNPWITLSIIGMILLTMVITPYAYCEVFPLQFVQDMWRQKHSGYLRRAPRAKPKEKKM